MNHAPPQPRQLSHSSAIALVALAALPFLLGSACAAGSTLTGFGAGGGATSGTGGTGGLPFNLGHGTGGAALAVERAGE